MTNKPQAKDWRLQVIKQNFKKEHWPQPENSLKEVPLSSWCPKDNKMINQRNALHHHIFCYINYYTYIYLYSYSWIYCKSKTDNFNKNSLYTVNIFSSHVGIIIILLFHVTSGVFFLKSRLSSTNFFLEVSDSSWRSASSVAVTSNDFYEGHRKKTMRRMIVWIDFMYNGCFVYS